MLKKIVFLSMIAITFGCENVIDVEVKNGVSQLVVDAWLNDDIEKQSIKLTVSQGYFDQNDVKPALGATVVVYNQDSTAYDFLDPDNDGVYTYTPPKGGFLKMNEKTALLVKYQNETYYAVSELKRVPAIDSVSYEVFNFPVAPAKGPKDGFLAQFYATDFKGEGDTYMVRYFKNDTLNFKPEQISTAYDAGFSAGAKTDGLLFILPIRQSINTVLYSDKDKLKVELFSVPLEAYYYLNQVKAVSANGGIFATPLSNIPTNIVNLNTKSTKKALGAFIVSKISRFETVIDKAKAKPKK